MPEAIKECLFRDVPDGGFFVERGEQEFDPGENHELSEKYGDHESIVIGNLRGREIELCRRPASKMIPRSDDIHADLPVVWIPRQWVVEARQALTAPPSEHAGTDSRCKAMRAGHH